MCDIRLSDYDPLIREVLASGGEFRLYPHGTSMRPLLRQGRDSVSLRRVDSPICKGDILFYRRPDGSYVLHRVTAVTSQGLTMMGDNQLKPETGVSPCPETYQRFQSRTPRMTMNPPENCAAK